MSSTSLTGPLWWNASGFISDYCCKSTSRPYHNIHHEMNSCHIDIARKMFVCAFNTSSNRFGNGDRLDDNECGLADKLLFGVGLFHWGFDDDGPLHFRVWVKVSNGGWKRHRACIDFSFTNIDYFQYNEETWSYFPLMNDWRALVDSLFLYFPQKDEFTALVKCSPNTMLKIFKQLRKVKASYTVVFWF